MIFASGIWCLADVLGPHPAPKKNSNDLSVLSTLSICPSNSQGKSLKPQSLFSISTFLSKTTICQPVFTLYKSTNSQSYLLHSSSHKPHGKESVPYSQFLRLCGLCSDDSDFNSKCDEMSNFFSERGYPDSILSKALNSVRNVDRDPLQTMNSEFLSHSLSTLTI